MASIQKYKKELSLAVSVLLFVFQSVVCSQQLSSAHDSVSSSVTPNKMRIALIVSPQGSQVWEAAKPIREGIQAAYEKDKNHYELVRYTLKDDLQLETLLNQIAEEKALLAIGPVLKSSVDKAAQLPFLPVPVLALNRASYDAVPSLFMSIDLTLDGELEQLVKIAVENTNKPDNDSKSFVILTTQDSYDERLARALEKEILKAGALAERRHVTQSQLAYLTHEMRGKDFRGVFFAMDSLNASLIRPYLPRELPTFSTSYTNPLNQTDEMAAKTQINDLVGMVTLEIPAVTHSNSEEFLPYQEKLDSYSLEDKRMFALGVDAWAVAKQWLQWQKNSAPLSGLTGILRINPRLDGRVSRELDTIVVKPGMNIMESPSDLIQFEEKAEDAGL